MQLLGQTVIGPTRESEEPADLDLTVAQRTATQEEMQTCLNLLRASCQEEGQSLTADTLWQRWQQTRRQAADVAGTGTATQSLTGGAASLQSSAGFAVRPTSDACESMSQSELAALAEARGLAKRAGGNRKTKPALIKELRAQDASRSFPDPSDEDATARASGGPDGDGDAAQSQPWPDSGVRPLADSGAQSLTAIAYIEHAQQSQVDRGPDQEAEVPTQSLTCGAAWKVKNHAGGEVRGDNGMPRLCSNKTTSQSQAWNGDGKRHRSCVG